jgi:DNA replication protein DnaC
MFNLDEQKAKRRAWLKAAHINPNRLGWLLEDCTELDEDSSTKVNLWLGWLQNKDIIRASGSPLCGKGLLLWGEPGHGKTTVALSILQEIMTKFPLEAFNVKEGDALIRPCYFITFNDILDLKGKLFEESDNDMLNTLYDGILGNCESDAYNIRVLVIDDLGKEHASLSGWQKDVFHHVLRTRFNNGLPTIVTTNIERKNWKTLYGEATESFAHEAFSYVTVKTSDLRK